MAMQPEGKATPKGLDWPEKASLAFIALAVVTLIIFGGILSALAFLICAVMGWTRAIRENEAKGKPRLSSAGRAMVGTVMFAVGIAVFPRASDVSTNEPDQVSPPRQAVSQSPAAAAPAISSGEAWDRCRSPILRQLTHPSSADFDLLDRDIRQAGATTVFSIGLTAKNGFGLELRLLGYCEIEGGAVKGAYVVERTDD